MTINEAIGKAKLYACGSYVTSEKLYDVTMSYHKGKDASFVHLCKAIASQGVDVVDDCFENAYRIICNVDHDGEASTTTTIETLILNIKGWIDSEVSMRKGRLMQAGVVFGIISKHS